MNIILNKVENFNEFDIVTWKFRHLMNSTYATTIIKVSLMKKFGYIIDIILNTLGLSRGYSLKIL